MSKGSWNRVKNREAFGDGWEAIYGRRTEESKTDRQQRVREPGSGEEEDVPEGPEGCASVIPLNAERVGEPEGPDSAA